MKVVMLGAGSTIGTFGASLGVDGFIGRLEQVRREWRKDYPDLARVVEDCRLADRGKTPNLDRLWTRIDYYSKLCRSLGTGADPGSPSLDLHRALLDAYSLTSELAALHMDASFTLKDVLQELKASNAERPGVLISFNWDIVAERVAQTIGLDLTPAPLAGKENRVRLLKPHGSLSWPHRAAQPGTQRCDVQWHDGLGGVRFDPMAVDDVLPQDGNVPNTHFCEPLVLGAVPIKSELLREVQGCDHLMVYETIADQWREVVRAIKDATELIVAGYGFPPEDGYGRFLLREAVRRRDGEPLRGLSYYSRPEDRSSIEASMRDIFGDTVNYVYKGKVGAVRV